MEGKNMLKIMLLSLALLASGAGAIEASFLDDFENPGLVNYTDSNSYGHGGSFEISGGKLNITTGDDNTFSVMTSEAVEFAVGETLSLEVPAVSDYEGVFMMCSTTDGQPDPNGAGTFGFRFRRDGGSLGYARLHLYPGGILADTLDPNPNKPATLLVTRTSDTNFEYSIKIEGEETALGSFTLPELSGITNLHIGAQAYGLSSGTFVFDNLKITRCGDWGYHPMDFNLDCYVNMLDFAEFAGGWLECTMPGELGCEGPFSIVILPDTQRWSKEEPDIFNAATNWIVVNKETKNIKFVLHVGDIVNDDEMSYQWDNADTAMSILDGVVPYCFGVGNHDMKKGINPSYVPDPCRDTTNFNNTFPHTRYEGESWYKGRMLNDIFIPADNYDNTYHFFSADGMDFMIVCLSVAPNDVHLDWADDIVSSHPNRRVIVVTHAYMDGNILLNSENPRNVYSPPGGNTGEQIWEKFIKKHENIFFVACGHLANGRLTSTGVNGNLVHQTVNNTERLRILRFVPEDNMIYVSSYDPSLEIYKTDPANQYDLPYNMN
jgi:hypothetical protein